MARKTLLDFFQDFAQSPAPFLVYDDGYRSWTYRYRDVGRAAKAFAARLRVAGVGKGERMLIWGENRPEWVVALWGCLLEGVVLVPIDYRASADFLRRVARIVQARALLIGDEVSLPPGDTGIRIWRFTDLRETELGRAGSDRPGDRLGPTAHESDEAAAARITADDIAEIIFTSGATADPKGVVITHRNLLANIVPVEREVRKYRKYGRPFFPLRLLNLLPLSHLFGQAMTTFIPPMLPGVVVFMRGYKPAEIVRQIASRRISVLVSVPKILDVLREHVLRQCPAAAEPPQDRPHVIIRWWRYRAVHRLLGLKFWSFVVGAAPLDPALEEFWSRLGFVVIQGYGLTETAPIVSLNHPFRTRKGSVGKAIPGVEVKIAPDGEILVRGENVTSGYFNAAPETAEAFADGWFHTGDIGTIDETGQLFVRGRKKEMIITPEGLNTFPEDVERVLNGLPGVRESAVVGVTSGGEERVHAVLVLEPATDPDEVVRRANVRLQDHQRIRAASQWPGAELPRTEGTRKLRRLEIKRWVDTGATSPPAPPSSSREASIESLLAPYVGSRPIAPGTTLEELGLSSLERVELQMALEDQFQATIDESSFANARNVGDLRALVAEPSAPRATAAEPVDFPSWVRAFGARLIRRISLPTWILPIARIFAWIRVEGLEHLVPLEGPVIFAANHQSHFDTPAILAALPRRWRYRLAPAVAKEFFDAHFFPERHTRREWLINSLNYYLAALFFNAFPLPQREAGTRQALRYVGELVDAGFSILIFPEGQRTEAGEINPFRAGIGMIASRLQVPVVPVRLEGLDRVLHRSWKMAHPGRATVKFGPPSRLKGDDYPALAKLAEDAVRRL